jgi:hypothetical protein
MGILLADVVAREGNLPALATLGLGGNKVDDNDRWMAVVDEFQAACPSVAVLWEPK